MNAGCVRATVSAVAAAHTRPPEPSLPRLLDCELLRCKQHLNCGLSAHHWEPLQKLVQCAAGFQVLKQGFYWHAGPGENRLTAHHPGFRCDWWPPGISSPKGILHKVIHVPAKAPWPQHHHRASVIFDTWLCQGVLNGCLAGVGGAVAGCDGWVVKVCRSGIPRGCWGDAGFYRWCRRVAPQPPATFWEPSGFGGGETMRLIIAPVPAEPTGFVGRGAGFHPGGRASH